MKRITIATLLSAVAALQITYSQSKSYNVGTRRSPGFKLILVEGLWSGKAVLKSGDSTGSSSDNSQVLSFTVRNNRLQGDGTIPLHHSCKSSGPSMTGSFAIDFSVMRPSGPNSFTNAFPLELQGVTYSVVVKGTFLTRSSASGSISIMSNFCRVPTVYTWTASPQADTQGSTTGASDSAKATRASPTFVPPASMGNPEGSLSALQAVSSEYKTYALTETPPEVETRELSVTVVNDLKTFWVFGTDGASAKKQLDENTRAQITAIIVRSVTAYLAKRYRIDGSSRYRVMIMIYGGDSVFDSPIQGPFGVMDTRLLLLDTRDKRLVWYSASSGFGKEPRQAAHIAATEVAKGLDKLFDRGPTP
jgi:hypothetical protein